MPLSQIDVNRVADEVVRRLRKYDQLEFVRPAQMMKMLGCKKSYLYKLISTREDFPKSYTMPDSKVRVWRKSEVERWAAKEYGASQS